MADMSQSKNKMPVQNAEQRKQNYNEVALGYTEDQAIAEAKRCLNCKNKPCVKGCPVKIYIPEFIKEVAEGNFEKAYEIVSKQSSLPAVCGRVCPQENQCEKHCVRAIKGESVAIGRLERFVADYHMKHSQNKPDKTVLPKSKYKVAIVGSGPAGLACAGELLRLGYEVTIYEALHVAGGVLVYGIPEFRLPKEIVRKEIQSLIDMGAKLYTDTVIGKTLTIDELFCDYGFDAVFIGSGAGLPKFMGIQGENLGGVYSANEFLTRINLMQAYKKDSTTPIHKPKKAVVVGGGNVAMDAARCAVRNGASVSIVYRRTMQELPARKEEVEHALEEGIEFKVLLEPLEIFGDQNGNVKAILCQKMKLSEPDESGRRKPVPIEGETQTIPCDCVIMSIGTSPNPLIKSTTNGLEVQKWGGIITDEQGKTSLARVYAGGDAVTGAATVILAMGAGKTAAQAIDKDLKALS